MRRIFRWIIGLPLVILVIAFAVANRKAVVLSLDPLHEADPLISLELPLWLLMSLGIFIGLVVGYAACWFAQGKHRRLARERQREVSRLSTALDQARKGEASQSNEQAAIPLPGIMP